MKKKLGDQMKDDYRNFRDPVKQSFRNMRDNIADGVQDAFAGRREDERPKRKGCLWTIVKWYIIICLAMGVLSECTSEDIASENNKPANTQTSISETILETQSNLYGTEAMGTADTATSAEDIPANPLSFLRNYIFLIAIVICHIPG